MGSFLVFSVLLFTGLTLCNGQDSLTVSFQMNGITGRAVFSWTSVDNLTVSINVTAGLGDNPVRVEIRPIWVDYDVDDKCSTAQLGTAISGWIVNATFTNNYAVVVFKNVTSLASLGGYSIVLSGSNKVICASIEDGYEHPTAVAQFEDLVQGTVYFRQSFGKYIRVVSDLYTSQSYYSNSLWFITDTFEKCSLITSSSRLLEFNPTNTNGSGCATTSQQNCAVGQLSGKLGNVTLGKNKAESRHGYTDQSMLSISAINGKLLIIRTSQSSLACAVIRAFSNRRAVVGFSQDGVTGSIVFSQISPFDPTTIIVSLNGLRLMAKGYHVHLWPTPTKIVDGQDLCGDTVTSGHFNPYNVSSVSYPAPASSTNDMYELGDLSSKHGTLASQSDINNTYTDWNLPLFGQNSILGRSLVIHRDDANGSRWICANIQPSSYPVVAAIAVFKYPVIGSIMFIQGENQLETSVFAELDYNDGRPGTTNHLWRISTNKIMGDKLSSNESSRCLSTGAIYDTQSVPQQLSSEQYIIYCKKNLPLGCKLGDLYGKLGPLNIRNTASSDTSTKKFVTDIHLPLSGPNTIIGRSLVIMNEARSNILACANIQPLLDTNLIAKFFMGGISGTVSFMQTAGFGAKKTVVTNNLTGLTNTFRLAVYEFPSVFENSNCSYIGNVYNPLNIIQNASMLTTDDKYMVGDLTRFGIKSTWDNYNLPLTGLISISKRSLVVLEQDRVVACSKIETAGSGMSVEAVSQFSGVLNGTIQLFQTVYEDGTMSDTSILVNVNNPNGSKSFQHNWHTHVHSVQDDANVNTFICNSTLGHIDPYMAMANVTNYAIECKPQNPLRCEMGDQAMKLAPYDIGGGRKLFTDIDLPLSGENSVLGRAMVFHQTLKVAARLTCADIIPVTNDAITIELKSETILDRQVIAHTYAKAIMANLWDVVIELVSESDGMTKLRVHFLGFQRTAIRNKFESILKSDRNILAPYIPRVNAADYSAVSSILLLAVLVVQLLNNI